MASQADVRHLTEYELDEATDTYEEEPPADGVGFDLYYDGSAVNPWAEGPHELVRLYFNDDRLGDYYVPITYAEPIEGGMRSTPVGEPVGDDEVGSFEDAGASVRLEQGATVDGTEFDLLWFQGPGENDERVVVAADFGRPAD